MVVSQFVVTAVMNSIETISIIVSLLNKNSILVILFLLALTICLSGAELRRIIARLILKD